MKIHILGICGTFMGGIAGLAREAGHEVSGSDAQVYPPMSDQLRALDIELQEGYLPEHLDPEPDCVVVGNVMSRGNPAIEAVLDKGLRYTSGPQWLHENILQDRWVLAVAGTHGKTTTTSMLAWILEDAGLNPGFLVGGVPENFGCSARLGEGPFFVVEADEYDTAFFDKRSKFVHYHPRTLILNNLEFDHADIFDDLAAIQRQFHHLLRTVPGNGLIIHPTGESNLDTVLEMGCWTPVESLGQGGDWQYRLIKEDGSVFEVMVGGKVAGTVKWDMIGLHNVNNGLAALAAARHAGVPVASGIEALGRFKGVKRRMQLRGDLGGVRVYDDFAHHPTAITSTIDGLRNRVGQERIVAVLEPRSNTMRMGVHQEALAESLAGADEVHVLDPGDLGWDLQAAMASLGEKAKVYSDIEKLLSFLIQVVRENDHILIMSNGGFGGLIERLLEGLESRARNT
ncbi:MAG: UDP-N-acetylmuramate:L-alanyl-gamma-D-glutamyl-meso-diaminopimelate ligase [Gammaproteobacteria bacterium]|nr:UDP-N-acetylmuramate:L-alanyl-gamma-D-glutamyl-meso-diaminopimelate ligase [Gammaproteobacteria bacterium]